MQKNDKEQMKAMCLINLFLALLFAISEFLPGEYSHYISLMGLLICGAISIGSFLKYKNYI